MQRKSANIATGQCGGCAALLFAVLSLGACATAPGAVEPLAFERYGHIERFALTSQHTNDTYTIEIYRPDSYAASQRAYPVLLLLDGEYAFDAAVALSDYMQRGEIEEHVIIGVSYGVPFGPPLAEKRTRNFTPPTTGGVLSRDAPTPYYLFLRDELLPEIDRRVRIDANEKTLWGYSLSGSFATWLNYYDPALFRNYVLASPNWGQFGIQ